MPTTKKTGKKRTVTRKTKPAKASGKKSNRREIFTSQKKKIDQLNRKTHDPSDGPDNEGINHISENPEAVPELIREEVFLSPENDSPPMQPQGAELPSDIPPEKNPAKDSKVQAGAETALDEVPQTKDETISDELQLVCFTLDNEEYGVDIKNVQEINRVPEISDVPDTDKYVKGVINLRGRVIPIIELRTLLDLSEIDYNNKTRVIVLDADGTLTGVIVDDVTQVLRVGRSQVVKTPELVSIPGQEFLHGIYQQEKALILVLDCRRVLKLRHK